MLIEKTFDTGEILMNYAEGAASGPPMVMLHGATQWWPDLLPLIEQLESSWHISACDHRGHGKSGRAAGRYRVTDYARDAAAFLKGCVKDSAVVVGHSLGGLVGLQVAAQLPQQVRALVLLDAPLELRELTVSSQPYHAWFSWAYETVKSSSSIAEIADKCKTFMPRLDVKTAARMAEMLYALDPECPSVIINETLFDGFDWTLILHDITCPTLLIWGEKDREDASAVRPEDAAYLCATVANGKHIQIQGTGHGAHREKPTEVAHHIRTFLNSIR